MKENIQQDFADVDVRISTLRAREAELEAQIADEPMSTQARQDLSTVKSAISELNIKRQKIAEGIMRAELPYLESM